MYKNILKPPAFISQHLSHFLLCHWLWQWKDLSWIVIVLWVDISGDEENKMKILKQNCHHVYLLPEYIHPFALILQHKLLPPSHKLECTTNQHYFTVFKFSVWTFKLDNLECQHWIVILIWKSPGLIFFSRHSKITHLTIPGDVVP